MGNSSWVPDEDAQTLLSERCWLQGLFISSIAYGIVVSLYFLSFPLLFHQKNHTKLRLLLLVYITVCFLLSTLFMISLAGFNQMAFIDDRNYPGGPSAFENNMFSIPIDDTASAASVLLNWFSDVMLLWRFKVIYHRCRVPMWIVMFFPCLVFTGSMAMGIMFLIQVSNTNPYVTNNDNYTLPSLALSLALNIILTIAIVLRLLTFRYRIVSVLGRKHGTKYTSIAAMIVESAALYSAISITFLVLFGSGNTISEALIQSLSQFQTVATLLIVFRVAQGNGWSEDTSTQVMTTWGSEHSEISEMQYASGASVTEVSSREMVNNDYTGEVQDNLISSELPVMGVAI